MKLRLIDYLMKCRILTIFIFLMGLTACSPHSSTNRVLTPSAQQENLPIILATLKSKHDYIIYVKQMSAETNEIWAVNPGSGDKTLIAKGDGLYPRDWSPSGNSWLFVDNDSLYVSNADGSGIRRVYQLKDKSYIVAWWLSDEIVLFDGYGFDSNGAIWPPPHQYYINIKSGETSRLDPKRQDDAGGTYQIRAVIPSSKSWIQVNGSTGEAEIADLDGNPTNVLDGYQLWNPPIGSLGIGVVPETDKIIFLGQTNDVSDPNKTLSGFWQMSCQPPKVSTNHK